MSGGPIHGARRIRILTAAGIPAAVPAADRERFRRMVQAPHRRDETERTTHDAGTGRAPATLQPASGERGSATLAPAILSTVISTAEAPPREPWAPTPPPPYTTDECRAPGPAPDLPASRREPEPADDGADLGERIARALGREQRAQGIVEHLAQRVAELCNAPQIVGGGSWEFRLDIDPAVLADTSLLLRLGGGRLSLRFDSRDELARQLVREHRQALAAQLAGDLQQRYEIVIDAW